MTLMIIIAVVKHPRISGIKVKKKNSKGGDMKLNFFKSNNISKKDTKEKDNSFILANSEKVMINKLVNLYREKKINESYMLNKSDIVEIYSENIAVADLIALYK